MTDIPFCKFHGFGNDYIVFERSPAPVSVDLRQLAISMCNRNTGVGSDGLAVLNKLDGTVADYNCEIVNPDGSFASFSGNGTRCAVAYLHYKEIWSDEKLRLRTRSGIKNYALIGREESSFDFRAEIGRPQFASGEIPVAVMSPRNAVVNEPMSIDGKAFSVSAVNIGNPVACIFVDEFDREWRRIGAALESHERFPDRVNAVFVKVIDSENIELRIWERGAGETSASGTCASGAAVLSAFMLKTGRKVKVHSPGGTTDVDWRADDEIVITGNAKLAFRGTWSAS